MANLISRIAGRGTSANSLQSIQRKALEANLATQKEELAALKLLLEDHKEVKALQDTVAATAKELEDVRKQIAGITK